MLFRRLNFCTGKRDALRREGASHVIERLAPSLEHRGACATTWTPAPEVGFGWRRDDAAAAPQRVPLAFTGRILNWPELAQRAGLQNVETGEVTEAELLCRLYCTEGVECFGHINGQFALALYDEHSASIVLAVDRWSVQPLYFAAIAGCWGFASEYRAFLALAQFEPQLDPFVLATLQRTKYLPTGRALLANVRPVAPGEVVQLFADGTYEARSYASLTLDIDERRSEQTLVAELSTALARAARRAIAGYDRIGIALSAGLDSTLTLGAVRAVAPDLPIHTYTASFDPDDPDLALAAQAARHFGTRHREIILAADDLPRLLPEMVCFIEDPCAREEMLVYHVLAQEAAPEVPVMLYGHMADVLFGGMPRHMLIKLAGDFPYLRRPILDFYEYTQSGVLPRVGIGRLLVEGYYRGQHVPPPKLVADPHMPAESRLRVAPREPLNTALLEAIRHPTEVAAIERLHSRAGVQLASVFHDAEVARCAFRIPDRLKIRGRCRKYILHKAAEAFLPRHLAARPKGMIRITQDQRLWRVVDTIAAELLSPRAVAARGLLDPADVARLVRPPRRGRGRTEQFYRLWTLLLTELWCRTFIDARGELCPLPLNPYARWPWRATGTTVGALSSSRPARAASS